MAGARAVPYSTGGGGVVLEHQYGAMLIAALLTGDSLPELGDETTPLSVGFQRSTESPVDDLLITGETPDGGTRRVSIGVRRAPSFTKGDRKTAALLTQYVRVVTDHWDEVAAGRWRLALATASRDKATTQVRDLAGVAWSSDSERRFRDEVAQRGQVLRDRLTAVDALVRMAAGQADQTAWATGAGVEAGELTWRLLSCLGVRELRLEGTDRADRTHAVARLRALTRDGTNEAADNLFGRLEGLSRRYAPEAAVVTREKLREHLSGFPLADAPAPAPAPASAPSAAIILPPAGAGIPRVTESLARRWRAGQEGWIGDRCYLLTGGDDGLLNENRQHRHALARQTDPPPPKGRGYVWLRQGGRDLAREHDLLRAANPRPGGRQGMNRQPDPFPGIVHFDPASEGAVTLALSWPADRGGSPCPTARAWFTPGGLDRWKLSLLLKGLHGLIPSLERLHRLEKSHRDLTPDAIIVTGDGQFALRDLGLAAAGYRPGEGPADYRAPEQAFGARPPRPGPATDVYQAAAIAYHLITGRLPVPGTTPPPARHEALPGSVTDVLAAALAARPADRPSPREFRAALLQ